MDKNKINVDFISQCSVQMGTLFTKIKDQFPPQNEFMLRHLAAAAIHMNFFVRDLYEVMNGEKMGDLDEYEKKFVDNCGCDYKDKHK